MLRGWKSIAVLVAVALRVLAGAVLYSIHRQAKPRGFSGLEFARLTPSASARTPLLDRGGALIQDVAADSPAAKAGIKSGEVLAAIDGAPITSARHASDIVRRPCGRRSHYPYPYDITEGEVRPRNITLIFEAAPLEDEEILRASAPHPWPGRLSAHRPLRRMPPGRPASCAVPPSRRWR